MSGNIKGIIVEIGGDTSGLQNALKKVNSSSANLSKELRGINTLLKFDPKSTELLTQKQTVLNENIKTTEEKLKSLQQVKELADKEMEKGTKISEENYRNLQREIINTENQLKQMKVEASNWTKAGNSINEFGAKIDNIGNKVGNIGGNLTKSVTAGVIGVGALAVNSMNKVDEGIDIIATKTGAFGEDFKDLQQIFRNVASEIPGEFSDIGSAIGEINTRLDLTGNELEIASKDFLKFAKVNGMDVNSSVQLVTRAMGDAGIEAKDYGSLLDMLTVAGQKSGISIESLSTNLAKYGAPMRALGIDTKQAIAMFAGWEKAGVNTEIAFSGMKKAISNWGAAGKDSTKEFTKTLKEIDKCPDIAKATTKAIEVFGAKAGPDLADAIKGGRFEFEKYTEALNQSGLAVESTYEQIVDGVDDAQLSMQNIQLAFHDTGEVAMKTLAPQLLKLAEKFKSLMEQFDKLDPEMKENIVKWVALVAVMGPALKIGGSLISTTSKGINILGKLCNTVSQVKNGMTVANNSVGLLAKGLSAMTTPAGLALTAITVATAGIVIANQNAEKATKEAFSNMGESAKSFISGIDNAESHLNSFNTTLFASSEEQQKLKEDMDSVQNGITSICKTASDERRGYTQDEINQLEEYFSKLRELKNREIEIQQSIGTAITQQAVTNAKMFKGSVDEYAVQSQEWIKTARDQKDVTVKIIKDGTTQQIALLNQQYSTEESRRSEEYLKEYDAIMKQQEEKVNLANQEVAKVSEIYANGYFERSQQNDGFYKTLEEFKNKQETLEKTHTEKVKAIKDGELWYVTDKAGAIRSENETFAFHQKDIWNQMYENMNESQEKQLGVWLANLANAEMWGGKIDDKTKEIVDGILASYNSMPEETKKAMRNAMEPMLTEMENKEPSLFTKATGIAEGILSRLRKSFDINSPSRKVKKIFKYVMQGAEIEIDDGTKRLYRQAEQMSDGLLNKFKRMSSEIRLGEIQNKLIEKTQTIFTTPQINFNVQELDENRLQQCFNYINRKFGTSY